MKNYFFISIIFISMGCKTIFCMEERKITKTNKERFRETLQRHERKKLILALNRNNIRLAKAIIATSWINFDEGTPGSYLIGRLSNEEIDKAIVKKVGTQKAKKLIHAMHCKKTKNVKELICQGWIDYSVTDETSGKTVAQLIYELDDPEIAITFMMNAPDKFTRPFIIKTQQDIDTDQPMLVHSQRIRHMAPEEIRRLQKIRNDKKQ